jgi:hypothetical protein
MGSDEKVAHLSVAYQRKKEKRKDLEIGERCSALTSRDLLFEICRIVLMPERDRLQWVRTCEKEWGFSVLPKPAAKKTSALKLVQT